MEIQFYGGNCVRITTRQASLVVDDTLKELGSKSIVRPTDIALYTALVPEPRPDARLIIADPGEYEVSEVSIFGIAARAHMDEPGRETATIYKLQHDDIKIVVLGHIYPDLSNDQLEELGTIDVLICPVGGNGYTLDAVGAMSLMRKIEPKIFIPTHYHDPGLNFAVPQRKLDEILKDMAIEPTERTAKYKLKPADFGETTQVIVLERV